MSIEQRVDKLIEVYLNWVLSTDSDAGWHQPGMLQRMVEFKGDIPPPTGNDQADVKMITEIRWLRQQHALLALAKSLINALPEKQRAALLCSTRRGTYDRHGKRWTDERIALELDITIDQLRYYRATGRQVLKNWLLGRMAA